MRMTYRFVCALSLLFFATIITDTTQAEPNDTPPYETLAKQSPSLQGHFHPLSESMPGYEVVLENDGEETVQNVVLSVSSSSHSIAEAIQPPHWECTNSGRTNCSMSIGELEAGQSITRTFLFFHMMPAIQAAQSCITSYREEFEEPVVTVTADDMEPLDLTGPGENLVIDFPGSIICPALGPGWTGNISPNDSETADDGPFIYLIEVESQYGDIGTLYFNDESYEIDEEQSDERWVFDESDRIPNETNRWRLDLAGQRGISATFTVTLAVNPIVPDVKVATEADAYIELTEPDVVLDGPVFGVEPIPLTKSGETVTCRCFDVATDGSGVTFPTPMPIPTPIVPVVTAGNYRVEAGGNFTVSIEVTDFEDVAALTVAVGYDPAVVKAVSCRSLVAELGLGSCNPHSSSDTARFNMVTMQGVSGDVSLAEITFEAVGQIGTLSPIDLEVVTIADTDSQPLMVDTINGQIAISNQRIDDVSSEIDPAVSTDGNPLHIRRVYLPYIER